MNRPIHVWVHYCEGDPPGLHSPKFHLEGINCAAMHSVCSLECYQAHLIPVNVKGSEMRRFALAPPFGVVFPEHTTRDDWAYVWTEAPQ